MTFYPQIIHFGQAWNQTHDSQWNAVECSAAVLLPHAQVQLWSYLTSCKVDSPSTSESHCLFNDISLCILVMPRVELDRRLFHLCPVLLDFPLQIEIGYMQHTKSIYRPKANALLSSFFMLILLSCHSFCEVALKLEHLDDTKTSFRSYLKDQAVLLQARQDNEGNTKNDNKRVLASGQSILFLCYKQQVSIYKGKSNNLVKTDEDLTWWN